MEKWLVSAKKADFEGWAREFGISPVLARIIRNRDITETAEVRKFLYGTPEDCYDPMLLYGMDTAASLILQKISEKKAIRVIGDYDVDGICSSYILTRGLKALGANVDTAIPHRIHDGYGLNEHLIRKAVEDGIELIVTCDNGIAAAPQIALAKAHGISVIVTDHHEVPFVEENGVRKELLPEADVIIDPKQEACTYPFPNICGGVVAFKLIQALVMRTRDRRLLDCLDELLQFAAIATVCDVMELKSENRIIVKEGLRRLRQTQNPGFRALMEVNGLEPDKLSAYHLGFVIGPCLNATGRLDTAHRALELLQSTDKSDAMKAAAELKALNDSRKDMTLKGVEQAVSYIEDSGKKNHRVLVVYLPQVHESLAGIIAGRIRELYCRPVFVLTQSEEGIKGSGRSIETYHMYENLSAIRHCFTKFGGHKLASGLTLASRHATAEEDVEAFAGELNRNCVLTEEDLIPRVHIDVPMPISYATEQIAKELELLEPFGVGNPKPLFAQKQLCFVSGRKMGARQNFGRYIVETPEGTRAEVVFFGDLAKFHDFLDEKFGVGSAENLYSRGARFPVSVTYQLSINSFRGRESLQFVMQNYC